MCISVPICCQQNTIFSHFVYHIHIPHKYVYIYFWSTAGLIIKQNRIKSCFWVMENDIYFLRCTLIVVCGAGEPRTGHLTLNQIICHTKHKRQQCIHVYPYS